MSGLFNSILYVPFFNLLVFLYNTVAFNDFGFAIILLTLLVRLVLSPFSIKALRSQKDLARLQPKLKEIQEKLKNEPQKQTQEVMELYRKHNVNPFSGCLPLLIQLPILIALYRVSIAGFEENSLSVLYSFIKNPGLLNSVSFGFIDLTKRSILLSLIAGVSQFLQTKMTLPSSKSQTSQKDQKAATASPLGAMNPERSREGPPRTKQDAEHVRGFVRGPQRASASYGMNQQMLHFFPLITIIVSMSFPAGLPLYWIATTVFSIFEQAYMNRITVYGEPDRKTNLPDR